MRDFVTREGAEGEDEGWRSSFLRRAELRQRDRLAQVSVIRQKTQCSFKRLEFYPQRGAPLKQMPCTIADTLLRQIPPPPQTKPSS